MRCLACNTILTNQEATRKSLVTEEYLDLCKHCLVDVEVSYVDNTEEELEDVEDA